MSFYVINPNQTFYDSNGIPRAGGFVTFFVNTTSTKGSIFSDEALTIAQRNPYELDASGRILGDVKYAGLMTMQVTNSDGSDVSTADNVSTVETSNSLRSDLAASSGSSLVGFTQAETGAVATTVEEELRRKKYPEQYDAVGDGVADDSTALQDWHDANYGEITLSPGKIYKVDSTVIFNKSNLTIDLNGSKIISTAAGITPVQWSDTAFLFSSKIINGTIETGAAAGKTLSIPFGLAYCELDVDLIQANTSKQILAETYSAGGIFDSRFKGGIWSITNSHTVPAFEITSVDTARFNDNTFDVKRCNRSGSRHFFEIKCSATTNWNYNNRWIQPNFEVTNGGNIKATGARGFMIENPITWDLNVFNGGVTTNDLYLFDIEVGGLGSVGNSFVNFIRTEGTLGSGLYDIAFGDCQDSYLVQTSSNASVGVTHNINNKRVVVIGFAGQTLVNVGATNATVINPTAPIFPTIQCNGTLDVDGDITANATTFLRKTVLTSGGQTTISGGVITVGRSNHTVETESLAATDDLDTITAGTAEGQLVILRPVNDSRTVVVKHNTGNIRLNGSVDFTMDSVYDQIMLRWDTVLAKWLGFPGSKNGT